MYIPHNVYTLSCMHYYGHDVKENKGGGINIASVKNRCGRDVSQQWAEQNLIEEIYPEACQGEK